MYHNFNDKNSRLLKMPSFKDILSCIDPKASMSKNSRSNKSFNLLSDMNKKREYLSKRNSHNKSRGKINGKLSHLIYRLTHWCSK